MKKARFAAVLVAAIAAGVGLYRTFFPSDEKLVRNVVHAAAEAAAINPNDNPLIRLAGANKLAGYCSPDVTLKLDIPESEVRAIHGRDELRQVATAARASLQQAKIQVMDLAVSVGADRHAAMAQVVVSYVLNGGDPLVQELKMQFKKLEGKWKIAEVETVKPLGP